jgi:hypothetical protein
MFVHDEMGPISVGCSEVVDSGIIVPLRKHIEEEGGKTIN